MIHVFSRKPNGTWQEARFISLNHNGQALGWNGIIPVVAGIEVTNDGRHLLAANYENDSVSAVDLSTGTLVSKFDLRPGISFLCHDAQPAIWLLGFDVRTRGRKRDQ